MKVKKKKKKFEWKKHSKRLLRANNNYSAVIIHENTRSFRN